MIEERRVIMKDKSERENLLIFISSFIIGIPLAFIIALAAESYTNKPYIPSA